MYYDGINLNPFEVLFVKVKGSQLLSRFSNSQLPVKYEQWLRNSVRRASLLAQHTRAASLTVLHAMIFASEGHAAILRDFGLPHGGCPHVTGTGPA
jgi:hypothetical protein